MRQIPPRHQSGTSTPAPNVFGTSPSGATASPRRVSGFPSSSAFEGIPSINIDSLTEEEKAKIVKRHLVSGLSATRSGESSPRSNERLDFPVDSSAQQSTLSQAAEIVQATRSQNDSPAPPSESMPDTYHQLLGGDMTHDLYKYAADVENRPLRRPRSVSFSDLSKRRGSMSSQQGGSSQIEGDDDDPSLDYRAIRGPGGFRRNFIHRKAVQSGANQDGSGPEPPRTRKYVLSVNRFNVVAHLLDSFIEFLSIYGHFAGEDLEDIDEDEEEEEEEQDPEAAYTHEERSRSMNPQTERTPLLRGTSESKPRLTRKRSQSVGRHGDASVTQAVLMVSVPLSCIDYG